ncbi:MAG: acetate--CoA ligase family protein, partial [Candidatus Odinarchaeia archaeon]
IIGVSFDEQFGHNILVGLGGIFVELLNDVSLRLIPIDETDAEEMLMELKGYPILEGYRSGKKADIETIKTLLLKISYLIMEHPEITEIDLNPVAIYEKGISVLDARMVLNLGGS